MKQLRTQADRLVLLGLIGAALRRTRAGELAAADEAAVVAELRGRADGRADLLAAAFVLLEGTAGITDSAGEWERRAAALVRQAGPDPEALPAWIAEGRRRARLRRAEEIRLARTGSGQ
jgi:hypothetical protein